MHTFVFQKKCSKYFILYEDREISLCNSGLIEFFPEVNKMSQFRLSISRRPLKNSVRLQFYYDGMKKEVLCLERQRNYYVFSYITQRFVEKFLGPTKVLYVKVEPERFGR